MFTYHRGIFIRKGVIVLTVLTNHWIFIAKLELPGSPSDVNADLSS